MLLKNKYSTKMSNHQANLSLVIKPVAAEAGVPEGFAERDLGRGVFGAVGAHDAGNRFVLWRRRSFVADVYDGLMLSGGRDE